MKKRINLLFALLYFSIILFGNISKLFTPLFANIYYGHLVNLFVSIVRVLIYLFLIITLTLAYKRLNPTEKVKSKELPLKKKIILYVITILFITIISVIAGWELKPLSDLGEKYTIIQICDKLGEMAILVFDIYIMMCMFKHFNDFYEGNFKIFPKYAFSIIFVLLTYSIYSMITSFDIYQLIFIPFTILLGWIYPYTEKSFWKTYLIAALVFLF
jgi:hypothetical protein